MESIVQECLSKNYKKYYKIAYSYTFQEQDAMDIVQEGAYRAILKSDSLKHPEYVDTWICRIMINEAFRFLKSNRQNMVDFDTLQEHSYTDEIEDLDLKEALSRLDEKDRAIVVLRYFEDEKLDSIGEILDLKVSTVKSRLYRAMEKLKKHMETGGIRGGKMEEGV